MRRLLGYSLLLMAVNAVCQVLVIVVGGYIDLGFGAFAGLVLIPLFQGAVLVLASPDRGRAGLAATMRAISGDPIAVTIVAGAILSAVALGAANVAMAWSAALVVLLAACGGLAVACRMSSPPRGGAALPLAFAAAAFWAAETTAGFIARIEGAFGRTPRVIVLVATYLPLLVVTLLLLLSVERALSARCRAAGRAVDGAIALQVAAALAIAGNFFHHPWVQEPWLLAVREAGVISLWCLVIAGVLFLRHARGSHGDAA